MQSSAQNLPDKTVNIGQTVDRFAPQINKFPWFAGYLKGFLSSLLHEDDINNFVEKNKHLSHVDFLERATSHLGISYDYNNRELENIPASGRVVIIANHPLGAIDGLGLLELVSSIRKDVKIVVNDILWQLSPLRPYFLQVNNVENKIAKETLQQLRDALNQDQAVIIFPAGSVSRLSWQGVKDDQWKAGFLRLAKATQSPILPVFIGSKNSRFFYGASLFSKWLGMLLLVKEMFKNVSLNIPVKIGQLIPAVEIQKLEGTHKNTLRRFKKTVYRLAKGKDALFNTVESIAHPEKRQDLVNEFKKCRCLRELDDHKKVYLLEDTYNSTILRELSRLREITFRMVGEGTGKRRDLDEFDYHYKHIILWDEKELEIIGAYRIKDNSFSDELHCLNKALYSNRLIQYSEKFKQQILPLSMELGRSFIQAKYWGRRSLDYLWMGIGAYLKEHRHIRYLFGLVSISQNLPQTAIAMLTYYHRLYYPDLNHYAEHRLPYTVAKNEEQQFINLFSNDSGKLKERKEAFKTLKGALSQLQTTVPTLFKQYAELCTSGGVVFSDFGIDEDFENVVDGLVIADIHAMKPKKFFRYIGGNSNTAIH